MNIRIGNDIKIKFTLRGPYGYDKVNVKQMRCYLVNAAFENLPEEQNPHKHFPFEPFPQFHAPSKYAVKGCGHPHYNGLPYNICGYSTNFCSDFHDYHWWPFYSGFGTRPDRFTDCHRPIPDKKGPSFDTVFLAPSIVEEEDQKASAFFPACEQVLLGPYRLIVVLVVWDQGWGRNNLHTYTLDYGIMFNLVDDETGMDGNIIIDGDTGEVEGGTIKKLYFAQDDIYVNMNSNISLGEYDIRQNLYDLYAVLDNGSTINYRYDLWQNNKLEFSSDDPIVDVTYEGKLVINEGDQNDIAVITVKDAEDGAKAQITVHINNANLFEYIGFANTEKAYELNFDSVDNEGRNLFTAVKDLNGNQHVENFNTGYYLWIISKDPIKDVNCHLLDVPLAEVQMIGEGYYCYHCPNRLIATNFDLTIEKE